MHLTADVFENAFCAALRMFGAPSVAAANTRKSLSRASESSICFSSTSASLSAECCSASVLIISSGTVTSCQSEFTKLTTEPRYGALIALDQPSDAIEPTLPMPVAVV